MKAGATPSLTIEAFESGRIDATSFDHEAHVYMGWLYLVRYDAGEAIVRFDSALRRLTRQLGAPGKYHATITWLFLLLIHERLQDGESWAAFRRRNLDLVEDSRSMLRRYYTDERLFSDDARQRFVLPDRLAA